MKKQLAFALLALSISACTSTYNMTKQERSAAYDKFVVSEQLPEHKKIHSFRLYSWSELDQQRLILNVTPSRPYLITFKHKCSELDFANAIEVKNSGSLLLANFDYIRVSGQMSDNCYIDTIHQLTKEQKKALLAIGKQDSSDTRN